MRCSVGFVVLVMVGVGALCVSTWGADQQRIGQQANAHVPYRDESEKTPEATRLALIRDLKGGDKKRVRAALIFIRQLNREYRDAELRERVEYWFKNPGQLPDSEKQIGQENDDRSVSFDILFECIAIAYAWDKATGELWLRQALDSGPSWLRKHVEDADAELQESARVELPAMQLPADDAVAVIGLLLSSPQRALRIAGADSALSWARGKDSYGLTAKRREALVTALTTTFKREKDVHNLGLILAALAQVGPQMPEVRKLLLNVRDGDAFPDELRRQARFQLENNLPRAK